MKTFPRQIIETALVRIGEDARSTRNVGDNIHRPGFGIDTDRSFAILVAEIAAVTSDDYSDDTYRSVMMDKIIDLVDEMREAPGVCYFPGWQLAD